MVDQSLIIFLVFILLDLRNEMITVNVFVNIQQQILLFCVSTTSNIEDLFSVGSIMVSSIIKPIIHFINTNH